MSPESKHVEGKLLDYAYGELGSDDSKAVEAHLSSCSSCADALVAMRQVRQTMSRLPIAPAPAKGLDSLMAYAEQTAERARLGRKRRPSWVRWLVPITGAVAVSVVLVISGKVIQTGDLPEARTDSLPEVRSESPPAAPGRVENEPSPSQTERPSEKTPQIANDISGGSEQPATEAPRHESKAKAQWVNGPSRRELAKKIDQGAPANSRDSAMGERAKMVKPSQPIAGAVSAQAPSARSAANPRQSAESDEREAGGEGGVEGSVPAGVVGGVPGGVVGGTLGGRLEPSPAAPPADGPQQEVTRLQKALADGAVGRDRARILLQLCEALDALKREAEADSTCNAVIREFPDSDEARAALHRQTARRTKAEPTPRR